MTHTQSIDQATAFEWAICEGGAVVDRFTSEREAIAELAEYPAGSYIARVPEPAVK